MSKNLLSKRALFRIHGWIGMKLSILFFIVCFSGTIAVFSHELDWIFNPAMRATPSEEFASRNLMVQNIQSYFPTGEIGYWQRSREPYLTDIVYVKANDQLYYTFVNPYTGEVQGAATVTIQRFFRDMHYYLFIPDQVGNFLVLTFAFVLVISLITGMLYYHDWYKRLFELKTGKGSKAFYSSLHKLMGAWSIPFMILIGATGIWYFIERADVGGVSRYMDNDFPVIDSVHYAGHSEIDVDYDKCVDVAQKVIPGLQVKNIIKLSGKDKPIYITGTSHVPLVRYRANRVYINPYNYEVMKVRKAEEINTITWLNDIADPLHFGYWGGWITKVIWFIFGLALSALTLTGPWLYIKRRLGVKQLKRKKQLAYG